MPSKAFEINGVGTVTMYKRKSSRTMRLTVTSDGRIRVTMPSWTPYQAGLAFVTARRSWILAQSAATTAGKRIRDGQQVGKAHHITFQASADQTTVTTSVRGTTITIKYPLAMTEGDPKVQTAARNACLRALRHQASTLLTRRLQQQSTHHDLPYRSLKIKRLKSRWGSCDQHKDIVLNLYLIQLPWEYIDYVILHELAHTKALNHGPLFWQTLEDLLPNARSLRRAMKAYQPTLFMA